MPEPKVTLEVILGEHRATRWMPLGWECTCGRIIGNASDRGGDSLRVLQAHQAEVIRPLIEADIRADENKRTREQVAQEIEATLDERVPHLSIETLNATSRAAHIARGVTQ